MPRIVAYQCRWTKKVFTDREKYLKHLQKQREVLVLERQATRLNRTMQAVFTQMREECETMAEIEQFITDHWEVFYQNGVNHDHWRDRKKPQKAPKLLSITVQARFREHVSNSHSAPRGEQQNWGSKPGIPTGFPGFEGHIEWQLDGDVPGFGSDVMKNTCLNTGSGGSRGQNGYGYGLRMYLSDWPGLARRQVFDKLSRDDVPASMYW